MFPDNDAYGHPLTHHGNIALAEHEASAEKNWMAPKFTRVREHATIGTRCARDASMLNFRQWFAIVHGLQQFHHEELAHIVVRLLGPDFHEYGSSLQHVSNTALGGKDC
jgi:hypothetical protein